MDSANLNKDKTLICKNCLEPQFSKDGILDFIGELCENCHEHNELINVISEDVKKSGDFDFSMNY